MTRYASRTTVAPEKSRAEIETLLSRYGADQFMSGWEVQKRAMLAFRMRGRLLRIELPLPQRGAYRYQGTYDQELRSRWRALLLVLKAKLEAVETGISTFDEEFLAHIQLPSGERVGDWLQPQVERAYLAGAMPSLLIGSPKEVT